jgi:hypothetical protein
MTAIKSDFLTSAAPAQNPIPATKDPDEVLTGAEEIGAELGLSKRKAYYHLEKGHIRGVRKMGSLWIGTRRNIRQANLEVAYTPAITAAAPTPVAPSAAATTPQHAESTSTPSF